jgi:hypothetical protein
MKQLCARSKSARKFALIILTSLASLLPASAFAAASYYVSKTGADTNPGTEQQPWLTIQHAANVAAPGSTVYVHAGTYPERVNIHVSGNSQDGSITFCNYPGETPIVDGSNLVAPTSDNGMFFISNQSYIVISGFQIQNYGTGNAQVFPMGILVEGACSYIQLLNNTVRNIYTTAEKQGGGAQGIAAYGTSAATPVNHLTISGNILYGLRTGSSESMTVNGNVQYFSITNNIIHDDDNIGIDAIGYERTAPNSNVDRARNGTISGNLVYHITSAQNPNYNGQLGADGIYVDGGTEIVIEQNVVYNADIGIEAASEHHNRVSSYVTIRNNLIYGSYIMGVSIGGYNNFVGGTDHCTIVNNTLYLNDSTQSGSGEFSINYHTTNNVFENNILFANAQGLLIGNTIQTANGPGVSANYNLYYSTVGNTNSQWIWNNHTYNGLPAFVRATQNDLNSQFANPDFVDAATNNFHLTSSSPALKKGMLLSSSIVGTQDLDGNPRVLNGTIDVGCYEMPQ